MKKVLPWIKSNIVVVITMTLALIGAPLMLFFGTQWNSKVRAEVEQEVSKNVQDLDKLEVQVQIDPVSPTDQPISLRTLPNDATIQAVSSILDARRSDSQAVVARATEFNQRGRALLIDGAAPSEKLFPEPSDDSSRIRLLNRMIALWPESHADLLKNSRAGVPPTIEEVTADLEEQRAREAKRRLSGREEQKLTPDEEAEVTKLLSDRRAELYRQRARQLTVYAEPGVFKSVKPWDSANVPPIEQAWEWQWLKWIHDDVLAAIVRANTDPAKGWLPVFEAPVKRIESIEVKPFERPNQGGADAAAAAAPGDPAARLAPDYTKSLSGRAAWPDVPNPVYDIRTVDVTVLVAADRLPMLLDAISKTNFMTVVGMKTTAAPAKSELAAGFDFGGDYLLRAELRIETVWLRSWTTPMMPKPVRAMLGIPDPAPAPAEEAAAPPA